MAVIINLNQARKKREKLEKIRQAERNRVVHGRTRAERELIQKQALADQAGVHGHLLDEVTTGVARDSGGEGAEQD